MADQMIPAPKTASMAHRGRSARDRRRPTTAAKGKIMRKEYLLDVMFFGQKNWWLYRSPSKARTRIWHRPLDALTGLDSLALASFSEAPSPPLPRAGPHSLFTFSSPSITHTHMHRQHRQVDKVEA
jgi:hypothetical protein